MEILVVTLELDMGVIQEMGGTGAVPVQAGVVHLITSKAHPQEVQGLAQETEE
jgi:hypothetical protein